MNRCYLHIGRIRRFALILVVLVAICTLPAVRAQSRVTTAKAQSPRAAFQTGEVLNYEIYYGFARGAEARIDVRDTVLDGVPVYHLRVAGWTRGLLDALYPVYDVYRSYTTPHNDLPLLAIRDVREQSYVDYKEDRYDRASRSDSLVLTREAGEQCVLPRETMDLVSVAFYVRNRLNVMAPRVGDEISIPTYFNGEFYPLKIQCQGVEVVKTKFGRLRCYKFVPLVQVGDLFKSQDAISVWLTADANHLPVRVRFKLFLGALYCDLVSFSGLRWPLEVEMSR